MGQAIAWTGRIGPRIDGRPSSDPADYDQGLNVLSRTSGDNVANLGVDNLLHRLRHRLAIGERSLLGTLHHVIDPIAAQEGKRPNGKKPLCIVDGTNEAIGSHVIPDSYLKRLHQGAIAPTTPVLTDTGTIELMPMGAKTEPVFPGYCNPCDSRLFPWETKQTFGGQNAPALQLMRTADAFAYESELRARVLARISSTASSSNEIKNVLARLDPGVSKRFAQETNSLKEASKEISEFSHEIRALANAFRKMAGLPVSSSTRAYVRQVTVMTTPELQLADVAWGPRSEVANIDDRVPVAISILAEDERTHLLLGSNASGQPLVDRIADHIEATPSDFFVYGLHWLMRGSNYWFAKPTLLTDLGDQEIAALKREFGLNRFIQASFARGAGPERTPIIRPGNGWT